MAQDKIKVSELTDDEKRKIDRVYDKNGHRIEFKDLSKYNDCYGRFDEYDDYDGTYDGHNPIRIHYNLFVIDGEVEK